MLTALPFTGVLTMGEALTGFSDANIVLIVALFVIGDGLVRTGIARRLGDWLIAKAGGSEIRLIALLMAVVAGEHAGGGTRELYVRGLCAHRSAVVRDRPDGLCHPGAMAAAVNSDHRQARPEQENGHAARGG